MSSVLPEFEGQAEFKIFDAIVGSINEVQTLIDQYQPDVIVSAGSNAAYLKASLDIPVLSLRTTDTDIINAVTRASKMSSDISLINFGEPSVVVPLLKSHLNISLEESCYKTAEQARELFHILANSDDAQKNRALVGASLICGLAAQHGLRSILIYSAESCATTLKEAVLVGNQSRAKKIDKALTHWLINQSKTPIILTDHEGDSITLNKAAKEDLNLSLEFEMDLADIIHPQDPQRPTDGECTINGVDWFFHQDSVNPGKRPMFMYQLYRRKQAAVNDASSSNGSKDAHNAKRLVFSSEAIQTLLDKVASFSNSPSNVLILGESGTGKELIAREVHRNSQYSQGRFVALNCSAIPTELFEGELFGHHDGAFTGSRRGGRKGLIEEAQNGVLFLDEISELALDQQSKLLRFLQERNYRPLGSNKEKPVALKLVAASNKSLKELVSRGEFREDLYFRLNVFNLDIPPLRMRPDDILAISAVKLQDFLDSYVLNIDPKEVLQKISTELSNYSWPGNVRELENILERVVATLHMKPDLKNLPNTLRQIAPELFTEANLDQSVGVVKHNELALVADAVNMFGGDKQKAAEYLGMSQTTLWRRLKRINRN
ncbi:sigma 54-interacting transcriptional regulator [Glaciecola sp. SC05]|uniref:sigma 54-interacting transcriptional regulator n=1 Tax=Glaciecola sp. SC05 TaxID=1987355 RepID=UPI003529D25F